METVSLLRCKHQHQVPLSQRLGYSLYKQVHIEVVSPQRSDSTAKVANTRDAGHIRPTMKFYLSRERILLNHC